MQSMLQNGLGSTLPSPKPPATGGDTTAAGDAKALQELATKDYFVRFAEGLAPSVGDIVYYTDERGLFQHTGIVVDASPEVDVNWISADGGQPAHATAFMKGSDIDKNGKRRRRTWERFWHKPEYNERNSESAWFLPRRVFRNDSGEIRVAQAWARPVWSPANTQGYRSHRIAGWVDIAHPSLRFQNAEYTALYTEASYRACKKLVRKVRDGALADQIACRAIVAYEDR
jgi:hypothetical protein